MCEYFVELWRREREKFAEHVAIQQNFKSEVTYGCSIENDGCLKSVLSCK